MQGSIAATFAVIAGLATAGHPAPQDSYVYDAAYLDESSELCGIYLEESLEGTYLAAYAAEGLEGEYVLTLRQEGPGGSSQISQSGEFESLDYGATLLSEMNLSSDGYYEASLQTYAWDGTFTCRAIV